MCSLLLTVLSYNNVIIRWKHFHNYISSFFLFIQFNKLYCKCLTSVDVPKSQELCSCKSSEILMNIFISYFHEKSWFHILLFSKSVDCWIVYPEELWVYGSPQSFSSEKLFPGLVIAGVGTLPACHKNNNGLSPLSSLWAVSFLRPFRYCVIVSQDAFFPSFKNVLSSLKNIRGCPLKIVEWSLLITLLLTFPFLSPFNLPSHSHLT